MKPRWEYKSLICDPGRTGRKSVSELNALGEDGWELVQILHPDSHGDNDIEYVFKRQHKWSSM